MSTEEKVSPQLASSIPQLCGRQAPVNDSAEGVALVVIDRPPIGISLRGLASWKQVDSSKYRQHGGLFTAHLPASVESGAVFYERPSASGRNWDGLLWVQTAAAGSIRPGDLDALASDFVRPNFLDPLNPGWFAVKSAIGQNTIRIDGAPRPTVSTCSRITRRVPGTPERLGFGLIYGVYAVIDDAVFIVMAQTGLLVFNSELAPTTPAEVMFPEEAQLESGLPITAEIKEALASMNVMRP